MKRAATLALAIAAWGGVATAAPVRTAAERQTLIDLAFVLGQAHALHRVCAGPSDDTWRGRMARLLEVEAPADAFKAKLTDSFNAGFNAKGVQGEDCAKAAAAEAKLAERGATLARNLSVPAPK